MVLETRDGVYPSGAKYVIVLLNGIAIGNADIAEGGYLIYPKRKPRPTIEAAAFTMLLDRCKKLSAQLDKWERLLNEVADAHPEIPKEWK